MDPSKLRGKRVQAQGGFVINIVISCGGWAELRCRAVIVFII